MSKTTYLERYFENEARINLVYSIETEILLDFYRNLEHIEWSKDTNKLLISLYPNGYIRSFVEYNGKKHYIVFYNIEQINETLHKLADYIYQKGAVNGKNSELQRNDLLRMFR